MGEGGEGAGQNVLCVPEFTRAKVLQPYPTVTTVYQGHLALRPIMWTEEAEPRDQIADKGTEGYDPELIRGLPCKVGQRVIVILPLLPTASVKPDYDYYTWAFAWRLRNLFDYRVARKSYSLAKQGLGVADTTGANPGPRVVIPALHQTIIYNQEEPAVPSQGIVDHILCEHLKDYAGTNLRQPLNPNGVDGAFQQGILPSTNAGYNIPWFAVHEMQAVGDELMIGLYRDQTLGHNWDFGAGGPDESLGEFLDDLPADLGVYVMEGLSP